MLFQSVGDVDSTSPFPFSNTETLATAVAPGQCLSIAMQGAGRESFTANEDPRTEADDGEHQGPDTEIYDVTEACFDLFERLLSAAEADYSPEQALLAPDSASSDELPRDMRGLRNSFAFWIDYTGALAPVGASLDDRLHGHEEIREIVVELLEMVERNLRRRKLSVLCHLALYNCSLLYMWKQWNEPRSKTRRFPTPSCNVGRLRWIRLSIGFIS